MPRGKSSARLAALTVGMLALAGCTAPAPEEPADGLPHLAAAIDRLPDRITALLEETGVPGLSVAVVHGDETVYAEGFGVANLDTGAPVDADTVFQLASVSKPVGATVIGALMTDDDLQWTTDVQSELPWFALGDPWVSEHLQLGDLYSHRSGLPDHAGDDLDSLGVDQATILERLRYLPLTEFRTHYAYTNFGIQAGAMAAASAADGDWMQLSDERLYTPLGMERTTSSFAEYVSFENHSVGHSRPDGEWVVTPEQLDDDVATAAGGVASSAHDMALWLRMLLAGGTVDGATVVDPDALAEAMTAHMVIPQHPVNPAAATGSYGRGFQVGVFSGTSNAFVSHSGAFAQGAGTIVGTIPALDVGVVVLSNGYPIGLAEAVAMEILDWAQNGELTLDWWGLYEDAFAGMTADFASSVAGDPPAGAAPAGEPGRYTGSYTNDYFGLVEVAEAAGGLELTLSADAGLSQTWTLEPYDGDVFRILIDNENATPRSVSAVTFDPGAGTVAIEFFDESSGGAGTFTRGS